MQVRSPAVFLDKLVETPSIIHGEPFTERRSTFQAHIARVHNHVEVIAVVKQLKSIKKIAEATHNIVAYRIGGLGNPMICDCDDDGETNAGSRLLHLLTILNAENVVVVVSRWCVIAFCCEWRFQDLLFFRFGGILLGPDRFKHICNAPRDLLVANYSPKRFQ